MFCLLYILHKTPFTFSVQIHDVEEKETNNTHSRVGIMHYGFALCVCSSCEIISRTSVARTKLNV